MTTSFTEYFRNQYFEKLQTPSGTNPCRSRGPSLLKVFEILENRPEALSGGFNVLETGCMRPHHGDLNFGGDGCATLILSDFVNTYGGRFISVDIDPEAVEYARSHAICGEIIANDSVMELWKLPADLKFDLIYLDSYDIVQAHPHPSQLHHLKELCAVMKNLKPGTLIVIDDHDAFFTNGQIGKGKYVKDFMQNIGAAIIYENYQIVFQMP